ncbi:YeeE/YedE family protein [Robertkochia sediminum]|uniref:YeeE/YedE family protein n=1 Tax=Robertkochia sediminum TaxID=2785326 RepID=UPI001933B105|nr:YeeE/YedE thiosulfate transporter family protein [Robertkochia sediminum]MBL7471570.1 YeeE/YedE family protein [Robertkochia sediminum]
MEAILEPWPWYVAGPLIALTMFLLLWFGKEFGMSANLRTMCSAVGAGKKVKFFDFDWKSQTWNLVIVLGAIIGGYIAVTYLSNPIDIDLNPNTVATLESYGWDNVGKSLVPPEVFDLTGADAFKSMAILVIAGFLVGFGARYAGGCTSGHAISGISNLQLPSLVAVIGFFIGGLIMTFFIIPLIFG